MGASSCVLDASAVLALLNAEPGSARVADAIVAGAAISAVNLTEVVAKLSAAGVPEPAIRDALARLGLEVVDFDAAQAYGAGLLRPATRQWGLAFGDRACLALGRHLGVPVLTADRVWQDLRLDVAVEIVRP